MSLLDRKSFGTPGFWRTVLGYRLPRRIRIILWVVVILYLVLTWPQFYWATPIQGKVVDAATGEPLRGVIVVARWSLGGAFHGSDVGSMAVMEKVTDENGNYHFSWWRPRHRPLFTHLEHEPLLLYFKPGHKFAIKLNQKKQVSSYLPIGTFDTKIETISLGKPSGSIGEYAKSFGRLNSVLAWAYNTSDCEWTAIPHLLFALHKQKEEFDRAGVPFSGLRRIAYFLASVDRCDNGESFTDFWNKEG